VDPFVQSGFHRGSLHQVPHVTGFNRLPEFAMSNLAKDPSHFPNLKTLSIPPKNSFDKTQISLISA
jgi:hypothetical protein